MATINIIDTCQLINDAEIIDFLINKGERVYISQGIINELDRIINRNENPDSRRAEYAKKKIYRNQLWIDFRTEEGVGDATIQAIISLIMGERNLKNINVYTFDKKLAKICRAQNNNPTIRHNCLIEAYQYEKGKEILTPENPEPDDDIIKKLDGGECWREENYFSSFDTDMTHIMPVNTDFGNINLNVIKYWAWHVKAEDYYKLYKKINLHNGDIVKADVLTFDNTCDVYARLCAYSTKTGDFCGYDSIYLTAGEWHTLSLEIDGEYDYINIEFFAKSDSHGDEQWDGMDGYINCFHIERNSAKN